jgi:predicted double-glycine peptidase
MKRYLWIALLGSLLIAGDKPDRQGSRDGKEGGNKYCPIKDAIKIPLPTVEQPDDYSCGAAALMSICWHFGVGPRDLKEFKSKLHTDTEEGTHFKDMVRYARTLGLEATAQPDMTCEQLEKFIAEGKPVICSMQAHADHPKDYDDPKNNDNGHYAVAIGFDKENFYFMDPSVGRHRAFLPKKEFAKRWHDYQGTKQKHEVYQHLGIVIYPKKGHPSFLFWARRMK